MTDLQLANMLLLNRQDISDKHFLRDLDKFVSEYPDEVDHLLVLLTRKNKNWGRHFHHAICAYRPEILTDKYVKRFLENFKNVTDLKDLGYTSQILHCILKRSTRTNLSENILTQVRERVAEVDLLIELKKI